MAQMLNYCALMMLAEKNFKQACWHKYTPSATIHAPLFILQSLSCYLAPTEMHIGVC